MTTPVTRHEPSRRAALGAILAAALVLLVVATMPAGAAASCGRQVIDDWYDDGRVDGTYALHCYDDAIEILPRDVRDYSSAKEDIERALQAKLRGKPAPPATTDPTPDDPAPDEPTPDDEEPSGTPPGSTPKPPSAEPKPSGQPPSVDDPGSVPEAAPTLSESPTSVPVPLLILAGLALLLVAGGSAGYVIRRLQSRRIPPPAV